jgi:predicted MFS family arabinose efflux permease
VTSDQLTRPAGSAATAAGPAGDGGAPAPRLVRLPFVVYVLAVGTFLMLTTEFVVAGLLAEIAGDLQVSVAQAGLLITVFAVGMIVGAPTMALLTVALVALLGLVGLSANPVLSSMAVRFAGVAPTLGVAMSVAAYNLGTAVGSWGAGLTLSSGLGTGGPAAVGTLIAALTLLPTVAIAVIQRRRAATVQARGTWC